MKRRTLRHGIVLLSAFLCTQTISIAQELEEQVEVQLVQVDLVATDSKGAVVTDLKQDDFVVKENGQVQKLEHFYNSASDASRYPLTIAFMVDTSFSMHEKVSGMTRIDIAVKAAEMVMDQLKPDDKIELIEFNDRPVTLVPFTSDAQEIRDKFNTMNFHEAGTAMRDSVLYALQEMRSQQGRKILVIFSDGMDTRSKAIYEDALEAVRKSDVTIVSFYSEVSRVNFDGPGFNPTSPDKVMVGSGEDALRDFSDNSGGQFFYFRKEAELAKAMDTFRAIVASQYTLAYTPPAGTQRDGWRKIKVECKRKGVKLRYREGYWAG